MDAQLEVFKGFTKSIAVNITDGLASDGSPAPKDISAATVYFIVKRRNEDTTPVITKTNSPPHTDDAGGVTTFNLTTTDTNITTGQYFYTVRYVEGSVDSIAASGIFVVRNGFQQTYCSLAEFKDLTNIVLSDIEIQQALAYAMEELKNVIFVCQRYASTSGDTKADLLTPWADVSGDNSVTVADLNIFELDEDTLVETDKSASVSSVNEKYGRVNFSSSLPTSGKTLVIEYYTAIKRNQYIFMEIKRLNLLLAVNWLFNNVSFDKLQDGIGSWTLNGVTVAFDYGVMRQILDANNKEIARLMNRLTPSLVVGTWGHSRNRDSCVRTTASFLATLRRV